MFVALGQKKNSDLACQGLYLCHSHLCLLLLLEELMLEELQAVLGGEWGCGD